MPALHYRYPGSLEEGVLVRRYKRFLADVRREDGQLLTVHCANPGAMTTCSEPGSRVRIRHAARPGRKLSHDLEQVRSGRAWVCVNTAVPNRVVEAALYARAVASLAGYDRIQREVADGEGSRIDFLLAGPRGRCWVEVKSVTLRVGAQARFPDAVTVRGRKHLAALARRAGEGDRAVMLYLVGRADVSSFAPAADVDPDYAAALTAAEAAGVEILPVCAVVRPQGVGAGPILPYHLGHE